MIYFKEYTLSDQSTLVVRNGEKEDGEAVLRNFVETHGESDFLLTYPEECTFTSEKEGGKGSPAGGPIGRKDSRKRRSGVHREQDENKA